MYYILYQIKRFLYICFNEIKKIKFKTKQKIKAIAKPKNEFTIANINFNDKLLEKDLSPFYTKSPLFLLIKKNKKDIFDNLIRILKNYDFKVKIGIEIEFYTKKSEFKYDFKHLNIENVIDEMGVNQKEIQTKPYIDLNLLVKEYNEIKNILQDMDFRAVPNDDDCSSALQINISLEKNEQNLFARQGWNESDLLLNCVAGLLKNINNNLLLYVNDENCITRFDVERNKRVRDAKKYPAPTYISWGVNNRSAAIRIPTPKNFKNYAETDKKERRIEFRVPSSSADIHLVLIGILTSIVDGIENNLTPCVEKTSFDVLEKNENLEQIESNFEKMNDIFKISENILFF
jgi:glutamine synthetase